VVINRNYESGNNEAQDIKRFIYTVYMVADKTKKSSKIASEIESQMDKLKLDMSYKPPKVKEVE
jgi:hypothetical protein